MFLKNIVSLIIPCVLALGFSFLLNTFTAIRSEHTAYGLLFFVTVCFILNIMYSLNAHSKALSELLMAGIVIKLLLAFTAVVVYSLINHSGLFGFAIHFITYYILFTIFEIRYLLHLIKKHPSK